MDNSEHAVALEELDEEYVRRIIGLQNDNEGNEIRDNDKMFIFKTDSFANGTQIEFNLDNYAVVGKAKSHHFNIQLEDVSVCGNCILFVENNCAKIEALCPIAVNGQMYTKGDGWLELKDNDKIHLTHEEEGVDVINNWCIHYQIKSKRSVSMTRNLNSDGNTVPLETTNGSNGKEVAAALSEFVFREPHPIKQVPNVADKIQLVLRNVFHLHKFIGEQEKVVEASCANKNICMISATGSGKSLCFQLPALVSSKVTIVLSPLLALIEDMTNNLRKLQIPFVAFSKLQNRDHKDAFTTLLRNDNTVRLLFVTPEMCTSFPNFMAYLSTLHNSKKLDRLVVDESHCLVEQRESFRTAYNWVKDFRIRFPSIPLSCFSATLNKRTMEELQNFLLLEQPLIFDSTTLDHPNVYYEVCCKNKLLLKDIRNRIVNNGNPKTIVFCLTQAICKEYAEAFNKWHGIDGMVVEVFHAKIGDIEKSKIFDGWQQDTITIIFTTTAFSMGINDPNVSLIILTFAAFSMSCVYQCFGRGGRKQQQTECVMFVGSMSEERKTVSDVLKNSLTKPSQWLLEQCDERLDELLDYVYSKFECRREIFLNYFDDSYKGGCLARNATECDCCINARKAHPTKDVLNEMKHVINALDEMTELSTMRSLRILMGHGNNVAWPFNIPWRRILRVMLQHQLLSSHVVTIPGTEANKDIYATPEVHIYFTVGLMSLPAEFRLQIIGNDI